MKTRTTATTFVLAMLNGTWLVLAALCGGCDPSLEVAPDDDVATSRAALSNDGIVVSTKAGPVYGGLAVTGPTKTAMPAAASAGCASHCGGLAVRACNDACITQNNGTSTCGQQGYACVGGTALPSCSSTCNQQSSCFDKCSANGVPSTCGSFACDKPPLRGLVSKTYLSDANRCVNDPVAQVFGLPGVGVTESFEYAPSFPETSIWGDHWQTIVRLPADPDRFFVTLNQEVDPTYSGFLGILNRDTGSVEVMQRNDVSGGNRYNHPGGAQALGMHYLFVAEEQQQGAINARIRIYDQQVLVAGLHGLNPVSEVPRYSSFTLPDDIDDHKGAAAVAVAKLAVLPGESGHRYLMLVASQDYSYRIYYWISQPGRPLTDPQWEKVGYIMLRTGDDTYINGWRKQQNMNLLTDCATGDLHLVSWGEGHTVLLHKLAFHLDVRSGKLVGSIGSDTVAHRDVNCSEDDDYCDWKAGAGSYVDAGGNLQVYGTSKYHSIRTAGYCIGGNCALR